MSNYQGCCFRYCNLLMYFSLNFWARAGASAEWGWLLIACDTNLSKDSSKHSSQYCLKKNLDRWFHLITEHKYFYTWLHSLQLGPPYPVCKRRVRRAKGSKPKHLDRFGPFQADRHWQLPVRRAIYDRAKGFVIQNCQHNSPTKSIYPHLLKFNLKKIIIDESQIVGDKFKI